MYWSDEEEQERLRGWERYNNYRNELRSAAPFFTAESGQHNRGVMNEYLMEYQDIVLQYPINGVSALTDFSNLVLIFQKIDAAKSRKGIETNQDALAAVVAKIFYLMTYRQVIYDYGADDKYSGAPLSTENEIGDSRELSEKMYINAVRELGDNISARIYYREVFQQFRKKESNMRHEKSSKAHWDSLGCENAIPDYTFRKLADIYSSFIGIKLSENSQEYTNFENNMRTFFRNCFVFYELYSLMPCYFFVVFINLREKLMKELKWEEIYKNTIYNMWKKVSGHCPLGDNIDEQIVRHKHIAIYGSLRMLFTLCFNQWRFYLREHGCMEAKEALSVEDKEWYENIMALKIRPACYYCSAKKIADIIIKRYNIEGDQEEQLKNFARSPSGSKKPYDQYSKLILACSRILSTEGFLRGVYGLDRANKKLRGMIDFVFESKIVEKCENRSDKDISYREKFDMIRKEIPVKWIDVSDAAFLEVTKYPFDMSSTMAIDTLSQLVDWNIKVAIYGEKVNLEEKYLLKQVTVDEKRTIGENNVLFPNRALLRMANEAKSLLHLMWTKQNSIEWLPLCEDELNTREYKYMRTFFEANKAKIKFSTIDVDSFEYEYMLKAMVGEALDIACAELVRMVHEILNAYVSEGQI